MLIGFHKNSIKIMVCTMVNFIQISWATAAPPVKVDAESMLSQAEFFLFLADSMDLSDELETIQHSETTPVPVEGSKPEHVSDEEGLQ